MIRPDGRDLRFGITGDVIMRGEEQKKISYQGTLVSI